MVELRGILREKLRKMRVEVRGIYPSFFVREPRFLVDLPSFRDATKIDVKYPLLEPFVFAHVKWDPKEKKIIYDIIEPELTSKDAEIMKKIKSALTEMIDVKMSNLTETEKLTKYLEEKVINFLKESELKFPSGKYMNIMYYIFRDFVGLNEIEPLMHDPYIEDIGCSGLGIPIYVVHRKFGSMKTNIAYSDADYLSDFIIKLSERCGRYISYAKPLLDGSLPDGSRIQASFAKDITTKGPTFSIRRFRKNPFSPIDVMDMKTVSAKLMAYLWFLIEYSVSILICGGVSTGKTTMLNILSMFISPGKKIISIEDVREINIPHENWIPSTTRIGFGIPEASGKTYGEVELFDLLKESFRMKPDYVIVGEVRGKETYVLFQGMASGNPSMGTIHSGSVEDVIKRLESPPIELSPSLIESLDLIIVMSSAKERGESARRIKEIAEIQSIDSHTGKVHTIKSFTWIPSADVFKDNIEHSEILHRICFERGLSYTNILDELNKRESFLKWMQKYNVVQFDEVCRLLNLYHKDKTIVMKWVEKDMPPYETKSEKSIRKLWDSATGLKILN